MVYNIPVLFLFRAEILTNYEATPQKGNLYYCSYSHKVIHIGHTDYPNVCEKKPGYFWMWYNTGQFL